MLSKPILILVALLAIALQCRAEVLTASNFPKEQNSTNGWQEIALIAPGYNGYKNVSWGQSFIATASGSLSTIETLIAAGLDDRVAGAPPLHISLYESNDGIPVRRLARQTYSANDFATVFGSSDHHVVVDMTSFSVAILAGAEYLVTYGSPFGIQGDYGSNAPFFVGMILDNPTPFHRLTSVAYNGTDWELSPEPTPPYTFELATRVWVSPEPGTAWISILGAMGAPLVAGFRRSGRR